VCAQTLARVPNQFSRLAEEDLQLFLYGWVVRERYSQLQIEMFNRAVCVTPPEVLQSVQPVFFPLVGEIATFGPPTCR
jgi:hypothetical protein